MELIGPRNPGQSLRGKIEEADKVCEVLRSAPRKREEGMGSGTTTRQGVRGPDRPSTEGEAVGKAERRADAAEPVPCAADS